MENVTCFFSEKNGGFTMYKDFLGWSLENINAGTVETRYTIECILDEKTWKKFCKTEDIELYSKREYDNISDALTFYLTWFVSDQCYDIKLWEQIFVNGKVVLEQPIEPQGCIGYNIRMQIDRDMNNRMYIAERKAEEVEKTNKLLESFIKYIGKEDMLKKYILRLGKEIA